MQANSLRAIATFQEQPNQALPVLEQALHDPSTEVRRTAVKEMGHFGPSLIVIMPALERRLLDPNEDPQVRINVLYRLRDIGRPALPALRSALFKIQDVRLQCAILEDLSRRVRDALEKTPELQSHLNVEDGDLVNLHAVVARIEDPRRRDELTRLLTETQELAATVGADMARVLDDPQAEVRAGAAMGLMSISFFTSVADALPALRKSLADDDETDPLP